MWPYSYIRKTESVAELKMKFVSNQNVKNGIGVSDRPTRTPQTSTAVVRGAVSVNGIKRKIQVVNSKNMIKDSVEDLSLTSKNSSRVKDLIKKLNEGSQQPCLQKKNGPICKNDASSETGSPKPTDRITNVKVQKVLENSSKTTTQDVLDVRKNSAEVNNRVGGNAADSAVSDKENKLPQIADLDTMYSLLSEKHSELLRAYNCMQVQQLKDSTLRKDKREIQRLSKVNSDLLTEVNKLQSQLKETTEHNELLEFRLLELDDMETTTKLKSQNRETTEDMSDSGVMSLATSDDFCSDGDQHENELDVRRCDNIKQRLMEMYNSVCYCVEDRSTINQVLALIRHFECRLSDVNQNDRHKQAFTDCLQESGIFEEDIYSEAVSEATQTESPIEKTIGIFSTDLTEELRKLSRIREKIEERKVPLVDDRVAKELSFYKEHWRTLERKIEAYESVGDDRVKLLTTSIDRESRLSSEVKNLYNTIDKLKEQNRLIEEEKCEFEEAENDTRLRCQKLENKFMALTEKKNTIQAELTAKDQVIETLRQELSDVDAKKCEARKHAASMEALVNKYEQRNFELEESEMETKCKLQILENAWPAIVLWNIWRAVCKHYRKPKTIKSIEYKGSVAEFDIDYLEKLRIMTKERMEMEKRIQDLEFKENVYQQTLQQADNILANVEEGYKRQIDELNSELAEKQKQLTDRETRMRLSADSRDREPELLDRIHGLETEVRDLIHKLKAKDVEKQSWIRRETQLRNDMEQFVNEVCQIKADNAVLRNQLDCERMKFKDLQKDINFKQSVYAELEEKSIVEAKTYQSTILKLSKQIDEYDVTNGELKEEVETLEAHVKLLRNALTEEKETNENVTVELNQELSRKQEIIDSMERNMSYNGSKNAAEELQCENLNTYNVGKLNLEPIDDHDQQDTILKLSNLKQLKTCDACFKNFEPLLDKVMDNFNNVMTTLATNDSNAVSGSPIKADCPNAEKPIGRYSYPPKIKQTACHLTKQAAMLEAKNVEKNKIIMMLADELLCLSEQDKWNRRSEFARGLDSIPSTRYAPDFNCTTVEKYLNGGSVKCTPDEKNDDRKYLCLIGPENPIGLHVVRQIGPDGIILAWKSPQPNTISSFEVFLNGKFAQRIQSPGRTTAVLCPVNLQEPLTITMNAMKDDGNALPPITVYHPFVI